MKNPSLVPLLLSILFCSCTQKNDNQELVNKEALLAKSEYGTLNPLAPKETIQFGDFVGKWNVISSDSVPGGWQESKATWTWRYILDGFAVEDVWHELAEDSTNHTKISGRDFLGKNIRIYDPKNREWNICWIENTNNTMAGIFKGHLDKFSDIVVKTPDGQGEITFVIISKDQFEWRFEQILDGKRTVLSKMLADRVE